MAICEPLNGIKISQNQKTLAATVSVPYIVAEAATAIEARDAVLADADLLFDLGAVNAILTDADIEEHGNGFWSVTLQYVAPELRAGDLDFSSDTTGGTAHITSAKEVKGRHTYEGATAVDNGNTIGEDEDGNVAGVDVIVPAQRFEIVKAMNWSDYDQSLMNAHYAATGKINSSELSIVTDDDHTFTFAAGEILFMGARANRRRDTGLVEIGFGFLGSANVVDLLIDDISVDAKRGHDYLDIVYRGRKDSGSNTQYKGPHTVTVRRVYDEMDLNGLLDD